MIRRLAPVAIALALALSSCSPGTGSDTDPAPETEEAGGAGFATQIDPPLPDYARLIEARPEIAARNVSIEPLGEPPPDAKSIGDLWIKRLESRDALDGVGFSEAGPEAFARLLDTRMSRRDFDAWVKANGWDVPRHIAFHFIDALSFPDVTAEARSRIRYWPAQSGRTGMQKMAAWHGKVFVRDGCFFVRKYDGSESLAWFLAETGLDVDDEGFLVLRDRRTGWIVARVGEKMTWAGPNALKITPSQKAELYAACGEHSVASVGNPESEESVMVRYPHLREPMPPHPGTPPAPSPPAAPASD